MKRHFFLKLAFLFAFLLSAHCPSVQNKESAVSISKNISEEKSTDEIAKKIKSLSSEFVSKYDSDKYPQYFGIDIRNRLRMIVIFHCPRHCKGGPLLFLVYENTDESLCKEHKLGDPLYDPGSDNYIGCEPYTP